MDLTDIVTQYGAEYKHDPKKRSRLKAALYNHNSKWDNHFTRIPTENTKEEWVHTENSEVLQGWQEPWTPKGEMTATPYEYPLFRAKVDIEKVPDQLVKTWMGFLANLEDKDRSNWPFIRWYLESHLIPRMHQDRYTQWGFLGTFVLPSSGTAGAAINAGNGVRKVVRDLVTDNLITPWAGGTFPTTAADMVTYVENMVKAIPEQYRQMPMDLDMRQTNLDLYDEGFRVKYNAYYAAEKPLTVRNYPNITLNGWGNWGTSNLMMLSDKSNRMLLQKGAVSRDLVRVETLKRQVFAFTDFMEGFAFDRPSEVFINDQDLS